MKIYKLYARYDKDDCSFLQEESTYDTYIGRRATNNEWQPFTDYEPIKLELHRSNSGKKNYKFDFSDWTEPFLIFSEKAVNALYDVLAPRGQFLEIITDSKRKKFIGYYPTHAFAGVLDLEKSVYETCPNGILIRKFVLKKDCIPDDYLFSIKENSMEIFVTEKFKQLVEQHQLESFDFSEYQEVELS